MQQEITVKNYSLFTNIFEKITKYSIYLLVFLLPLLFLPWTFDYLDFNKQALLMGAIFISLFAWIVKSLVLGRVTLNISKLNILVGLLLLVYLISSIFSVFKYGSLWGWPQPAYESLITMVCFCLAYFLISTTFSKSEVFYTLVILSFSFLCFGTYGILQLLGIYIFDFDFVNNIYFNTVGSVGILGLLCAMLLPLFIIFLIIAKKWWKVLYAINIALALLILLLINYTYLWWLVFLFACFLTFFWILKRDMFDGKWMFLPTFFIVLPLFFIIFNPQISFLKNKPLEITLSASTNAAVAIKTLDHFPLFGSGPGTFAYDFLKNNKGDLNSTSLWNLQFNLGFSKFLTTLVTAGVLGIFAWLALQGYALFCGIKKIMGKKHEERKGNNLPILLGVVLVLVVQFAGVFFFNSSITFEFIYFIFIGLLAVLLRKNHTTYLLKPSSLLTLLATFIFTMVVIFGAGLLILEFKRYVANVNYTSAVVLVAKGDVDEGQKLLQKATNLDGADLYFRQLSQIYLLKIKNIVKSDPSPSKEITDQLRALFANAINSAKMATDINPNDANNWSFRGNVYQNLIDLIDDADKWALKSYDSAIALSPGNPYLLLQKGSVYYQQKDYENAKVNFEKALSLKSDYPDLLYFLGLTYDNLGMKNKALDMFTKLSSLGVQDSNILVILNNLKSGKPALDGLVQSQVVSIPLPAPKNDSTPSLPSP